MESNIQGPKFLNFNEAKKFLGISANILRELNNTNKITFYRPNGKLYKYKVEDLNAWLESQKVPAVTEA